MASKVIKIDTEHLKHMYLDNNFTVKEIAKALEVPEYSIIYRLKKFGFTKNLKHPLNDQIFGQQSAPTTYWAGFIAADGNVYKNTLKIKLAIKDEQHLYKLCDLLERDYILYDDCSILGGEKTYCSKTLKIESDIIVNDLKINFGIIPAKTFVLEPPTLPYEMIKHYIRGFFDGDGSISTSKNEKVKVHFVSGSKGILVWIIEQFRQQTGDNTQMNVRKRRDKNFYEIDMSANKARSFLDWIYTDSTPDIRLDRKYERYLKYTS